MVIYLPLTFLLHAVNAKLEQQFPAFYVFSRQIE